MPIPLADALVRVRLVADKSDFKAQTSRQVDDATKMLRVQVGNLRKEARAFGIIGRDLNKIASTIFKFVVAPTIALGGLGVKKYMETTEVGAKKLREAMAGLHHSWDQFLARVGRVIYNSGILSKVIEKLSHFLNSLNDEKILRIINYAKWAAILGVITKIGGVIATMTSNILRFRAALGTLELLNLAKTGGLAVGEGGVISATAAGAAGKNATKQSVITGAATGATGIGLWQSLIRLPKAMKGIESIGYNFTKYVHPEQTPQRLPFLKEIYGNLKQLWAVSKTRSQIERIPFTGRGSMQHTRGFEGIANTIQANKVFSDLEPVLKIMRVLGTTLGFLWKAISKIIVPAEIIAGLLRGLGFKFKDGTDLIWSGIKGLWWAIKGIAFIPSYVFKVLFSGFQSIGVILRNIFTGSFQQMADELENLWHDFTEELGIAWGNWWTPLEKEQAGNIKSRERKAKDLQFMPKNITTTSFAGLQEAAQEMVNRQAEMDSMSKLTDSNVELDKDIVKLSDEVKKFNAALPQKAADAAKWQDARAMAIPTFFNSYDAQML
jgi:hypothetical protein